MATLETTGSPLISKVAGLIVSDIPDYPHDYGEPKSSKGYVGLSIVKEYLKKGYYERALEVALKIDNRSFRRRSLLAIGRKYAAEKNFFKALEIANKIEFATSRYPSGFVFYYTSDSLQYEAKNKVEFLFQIASLAAKSGNYDLALQIADLENNNQLSSNILLAIALQYFKEGKTTLGDEFLKHSLETSEVFYRLQLAQNTIYAGFAERLLSLSEYFSDQKTTPFNSQREDVLSLAAANLIEKGKLVEAERVIKELPEDEKFRLQQRIVSQLIEKGSYDEALNIAKALPDKDERYRSILSISKKYFELGSKDKSRQLIQTAIDSQPLYYPSVRLSIFAQELGFDDLALSLAQKESINFQASIYQNLALKYFDKGDSRRAFEMLELMRKAVSAQQENISNRSEQKKFLQLEIRDRRNSFFQELVKRAIAGKNYDLALEHADKMTDAFESEYFGNGFSYASAPNMQKSLFLSDITVQFAKSGALEKSIQAAVKIRDIQTRDRTWEAISLELSSSGNYQAAIAIANRIQAPLTRNRISNLLTCAATSQK